MTRSVSFHPLATAEVVDAHRWYEQRLDGLGERFLDLARHPGSPALDGIGEITRTI